LIISRVFNSTDNGIGFILTSVFLRNIVGKNHGIHADNKIIGLFIYLINPSQSAFVTRPDNVAADLFYVKSVHVPTKKSPVFKGMKGQLSTKRWYRFQTRALAQVGRTEGGGPICVLKKNQFDDSSR
jgi:hypothetical protein